jgi:hypothetical protein
LNHLNIIKRLEVIKNLISLEEEEEICLHIIKLKTLQLNDDVKIIISYLENKAFSKAIPKIEKFISNHRNLAIFVDPEIEALRFEAKTLEFQLQQLSDEKAELEKLIREFEVRHNKELGLIILKILQYRKEQHKETPQEEETKNDYESFYSDFEAIKAEKIEIITENELKELKEKYRKASKLCHPDVVEELYKEEASKIFIELNTAYEQNNLQRVTEILESLQQGKIFTSKADTTNEKLSLQIELERLRNRLDELTKVLFTIKNSEVFEKIVNIKDWDEYFSITKKQLKEQLNQIERERK